MYVKSQDIVALASLAIIFVSGIQGSPPDGFSSGDLNRENPSQTVSGSDPTDLESELVNQPARRGHNRSRGRHHGRENRANYNENTLSEDKLEHVQYADANKLGKVVKDLQQQIKRSKTSQVRTRSILNVMQEKQVMQDRNLQVLKDEIREVREAQQEDHEALMALRQLVSDSAWAVNNLKTSQDNIRYDCVLLKQTQAYHNDTVLELGSSLHQNEARSVSNQANINQLRTDMRDLRDTLHKDRTALRQLQNLVTTTSSHKNQHYGGRNKAALPRPHSNKIPSVPNPTSLPVDSSGLDPGRADLVSSSLEEERNTIGHSVEELMIHKDKTQEQMEHIEQKFFQHDAEFSRFYTLFYNLSLQVSNLENKLLVHQKSRFDTELAEMQRMFMNFTQQMFHLEQWGSSARNHLNTSSQNQAEISQIQNNLENHMNRIRAIENLLVDYRTRASHNLDMVLNRVSMMNDTVQEVYRRVGDHSRMSSNVVTDVDEKILEFRTQQMHTDDRITRMEVRFLNSTLERCEKGSNDLMQDMKLSDFSNELNTVDGTVTDHESKLKRLDRGFSQLYQEIERHTRSLGDMMRQTSSILNVVPDVNMLKDEIHNIVMDLPKDCTTALEAHSKRGGLFLLRPDRSKHTLRAYCEESPEGAWTIIQRRLDGSLSFARSWEDYKSGFGQPDGEFWIGNDNLHYLTTQDNYILRLDMWDLENNYYFAEYDFFKVDEETTNYRLHIDGYSGNSTDALRYSNFMPFSTMDKDNDVSSTHCAKFYTAGWWYKHCHYSNLNGRYTVGVVWFNHNIDEWVQMHKTVMKIRPTTHVLAPGSGSG